MILQKEIANIAETTGVTKAVIDKDWVLGHFVAAMYTIPEIKKSLVFKGGTCLRKCWFPDYRFSEDLDFTSQSEAFELTDKHLIDICDKMQAHSGIQTHVVSLKPIRFRDQHVGYEAIVKYWGADHSKNEAPPPPERWLTKIKVEVILYEKMVFKPTEKVLQHPYSDAVLNNDPIPCYTIAEILSEKIRALIQRSYTAPRDYYDIWYLANNVTDLDWGKIIAAFHEKMAYKGLEYTGIEQLTNPKSERAVKLAWDNSLGHQVNRSSLPLFEEVQNKLRTLLNSLLGNNDNQ